MGVLASVRLFFVKIEQIYKLFYRLGNLGVKGNKRANKCVRSALSENRTKKNVCVCLLRRC